MPTPTHQRAKTERIYQTHNTINSNSRLQQQQQQMKRSQSINVKDQIRKLESEQIKNNNNNNNNNKEGVGGEIHHNRNKSSPFLVNKRRNNNNDDMLKLYLLDINDLYQIISYGTNNNINTSSNSDDNPEYVAVLKSIVILLENGFSSMMKNPITTITASSQQDSSSSSSVQQEENSIILGSNYDNYEKSLSELIERRNFQKLFIDSLNNTLLQMKKKNSNNGNNIVNNANLHSNLNLNSLNNNNDNNNSGLIIISQSVKDYVKEILITSKVNPDKLKQISMNLYCVWQTIRSIMKLCPTTTNNIAEATIHKSKIHNINGRGNTTLERSSSNSPKSKSKSKSPKTIPKPKPKPKLKPTIDDSNSNNDSNKFFQKHTSTISSISMDSITNTNITTTTKQNQQMYQKQRKNSITLLKFIHLHIVEETTGNPMKGIKVTLEHRFQQEPSSFAVEKNMVGKKKHERHPSSSSQLRNYETSWSTICSEEVNNKGGISLSYHESDNTLSISSYRIIFDFIDPILYDHYCYSRIILNLKTSKLSSVEGNDSFYMTVQVTPESYRINFNNQASNCLPNPIPQEKYQLDKKELQGDDSDLDENISFKTRALYSPPVSPIRMNTKNISTVIDDDDKNSKRNTEGLYLTDESPLAQFGIFSIPQPIDSNDNDDGNLYNNNDDDDDISLSSVGSYDYDDFSIDYDDGNNNKTNNNNYKSSVDSALSKSQTLSTSKSSRASSSEAFKSFHRSTSKHKGTFIIKTQEAS